MCGATMISVIPCTHVNLFLISFLPQTWLTERQIVNSFTSSEISGDEDGTLSVLATCDLCLQSFPNLVPGCVS